MEQLFCEYDVWTFKKDTNGRWIWVRYSPDGEALAASRADFEHLCQCVRDAAQRGYRGDISAYEHIGSAEMPEQQGGLDAETES